MPVPQILITGIFLVFVGLVLHIIAMSTVEWTITSPSVFGVSAQFGLYQFCTKVLQGIKCIYYTELPSDSIVPEQQKAAASFATFGVLLAGGGVIVAIIYAVLPLMNLMSKIAGVACIAGATCTFLAVAIWAVGMSDKVDKIVVVGDTETGYSLYLSAVAGTLFLVGGFCFISVPSR